MVKKVDVGRVLFCISNLAVFMLVFMMDNLFPYISDDLGYAEGFKWGIGGVNR